VNRGCVGCHGRNEDMGHDSLSPGRGAGLRQHHTNAGAPPDSGGLSCSTCHVDANPSNYACVGEDVSPPFYGVVTGVVPTDACTDNLDNDGELLYDLNDPDCVVAATPTPSETPIWSPTESPTPDHSPTVTPNPTPTETPTLDLCEGVVCPATGNDCTANVCDPGDGLCKLRNVPEGTPCDDRAFCTVGDACTGGVCSGGQRNCDDGLFCTGSETCNETRDTCVSSANPCDWLTETCNEATDTCDPGGFHPQALTDCSVCHADRATGFTNLLDIHGRNCTRCHTSGLSSTLLGPIGVWNGECGACHNPGVAETGNLETPTKGHRCIVCHGRQMPTSDFQGFHKKHAEKANCVVCHGFIPDRGTVIGSGSRDICATCHSNGEDLRTRSTEFHKKHISEGLSCLECHGGEHPPVDVFNGVPVGGATNVCQVCHENRSPTEFSRKPEELHQEHVEKGMDCGACHAAAILQDDRQPMPAIDDGLRALVDRAGENECFHCHRGGEHAGIRKIHREHVAEQAQWCFNCHEPDDGRPQGDPGPVTEPAESCALCHDDKAYGDFTPFRVHKKHAEDVKCYACRQTMPPLFSWPGSWMMP